MNTTFCPNIFDQVQDNETLPYLAFPSKNLLSALLNSLVLRAETFLFNISNPSRGTYGHMCYRHMVCTHAVTFLSSPARFSMEEAHGPCSPRLTRGQMEALKDNVPEQRNLPQNHRIIQAGRDLWRRPSPPRCSKRGQFQM